MNILFIYSSNISVQKGGVQRVTNVLSSFFQKQGYNCSFLSTASSADDIPNQYIFPKECKTEQAKIGYIRSLLSSLQIEVVINQDGLNKKMTPLVHRSCFGKARIYTVAHNSLLAPADKLTIVKCPLLERFHLLWLIPFLNMSIVRLLILNLYRIKYKKHYQDILTYSNNFILLSNAYKKELSFILQSEELSKVLVIPNPCTIDVGEYSLDRKTRSVLFVGRIDFPQKRNDLLLRVWEKVESTCPDWNLTIVGDGPDLQKLKLMAEDLRLRNVKFAGFDDPRLYYKTSCIFCLTSAYEGFPLVLTEAMSYGNVPIAFDSFGAAKDIILDEKNGRIVKPYDMEAYADCLIELMTDFSKRMALARNATHSTKAFLIDNIGNIWLSILK